jgi:hypothetical protein
MKPKTGVPFPLVSSSESGILILANFHFFHQTQFPLFPPNTQVLRIKTENIFTTMPRRRAINDVSIRYRTYLIEFMSFLHERVQLYPSDTDFEQDVLVQITPRDTERWMCKKVYGMTDPGLDDHPIHGRSWSLEFYKKALSYFMPNKRMSWNEVTQTGNPTKSSEIIDRIKKVKKEEVRKTGKKSSARRPLEHREFKQSLAILESDPDPIKRFLAPCVNKVQYNLIARLDDAMELEMEDIKPNLHFPFALLVQMCWSKNVNEQRDAGEQILLGSMKREYCILLALAMFLEVWIGGGAPVRASCDMPCKSGFYGSKRQVR